MNFSVRYPFNYANHIGIPMISSTNVTVNTDNVVITIPRNSFRRFPNSGIIIFRLNEAIPTTGAALPVLISSGGFTQAVTVNGGADATGTEMATAGIYLIWYDKNQNLLQLLTVAP